MERMGYDTLLRCFESMTVERNLWRRACQILAVESGFDLEQAVLEAYKSALKEHKNIPIRIKGTQEKD